MIQKNEGIVLTGIGNSAVSYTSTKEKLNDYIDFLQDQPEYAIFLEGFTNSSSSASGNERIS